MKNMRVEKTLVSTNRIDAFGHRPLLVVQEKVGGGRSVAVDAVGCIPGDWVICVGSSAAREAPWAAERALCEMSEVAVVWRVTAVAIASV